LRTSIYTDGRRGNSRESLLVRQAAPLDRIDRPGVVTAGCRGRLGARGRALDECEFLRSRVLAAALLRLWRADNPPRHCAVDRDRAAVLDRQVDRGLALVLLIERRAVGERTDRLLDLLHGRLGLSERRCSDQCK